MTLYEYLAYPSHTHFMSKKLAVFLLIFCSLQYGWQLCRDSVIEHVIIDVVTVQPAALLARMLTPQHDVVAVGHSLHSPQATMNVLNGCEGLDALFLLVAAFMAATLPWRVRFLYIATGALLVYALNQLRLVALWQLYLINRDWFGISHTLLFPLGLMLLCYAHFAACMARQERKSA